MSEYVDPTASKSAQDDSMAGSASPTHAADKRGLEVSAEDSSSPQKQPNISSIRLGIGSADKIGELNARDYDDDLRTMAEEYRTAIEAGECFVHVRAKQSSNQDLRMLSQLTGGGKFRKVNLSGIGMESVVTKSGYLADLLEKANCTSKEKAEKILEDEIKGADWDSEVKGFEQHMKEEEEVRLDWTSGKFESGNLRCPTCGDKNVCGIELTHAARTRAKVLRTPCRRFHWQRGVI